MYVFFSFSPKWYLGFLFESSILASKFSLTANNFALSSVSFIDQVQILEWPPTLCSSLSICFSASKTSPLNDMVLYRSNNISFHFFQRYNPHTISNEHFSLNIHHLPWFVSAIMLVTDFNGETKVFQS